MSALTSVISVFDAIGTWITGAVTDLLPMFYSGEQLTILGVLAVASLAVSVVFLLIGFIQKFLHFAG